ncbi:hypothetical protein [Kocuria sp. SM24M-10]|uniref:hypothetical protein n=1 Tax=Kocuria sp. SM24M-10 TaxID=1660349 RepID=UPI00064B7536|nr:hypothetical protein [Kocuria sp. SM24M-10]KLU08314.1 hypothetical protein ABL57_18770 [Kocuria sp. SM24M-10]
MERMVTIVSNPRPGHEPASTRAGPTRERAGRQEKASARRPDHENDEDSVANTGNSTAPVMVWGNRSSWVPAKATTTATTTATMTPTSPAAVVAMIRTANEVRPQANHRGHNCDVDRWANHDRRSRSVTMPGSVTATACRHGRRHARCAVADRHEGGREDERTGQQNGLSHGNTYPAQVREPGVVALLRERTVLTVYTTLTVMATVAGITVSGPRTADRPH